VRAICVAGILHTTAAVIGGLEALVSVFTGLTAVLGGLGIAGVGLAIGGKLRIAAWLMVASAVGFLASSVLYNAGKIILVPMPDVQHEPRYPTEISDYLRFLCPTPLPLLVGAALALLARRMESEQNSS